MPQCGTLLFDITLWLAQSEISSISFSIAFARDHNFSSAPSPLAFTLTSLTRWFHLLSTPFNAPRGAKRLAQEDKGIITLGDFLGETFN